MNKPTDLIVPNRRLLLAGLGAVICAPAIVRASSLMPVKMIKFGIHTISCEVFPTGVIWSFQVSLPEFLARYHSPYGVSDGDRRPDLDAV